MKIKSLVNLLKDYWLLEIVLLSFSLNAYFYKRAFDIKDIFKNSLIELTALNSEKLKICEQSVVNSKKYLEKIQETFKKRENSFINVQEAIFSEMPKDEISCSLFIQSKVKEIESNFRKNKINFSNELFSSFKGDFSNELARKTIFLNYFFINTLAFLPKIKGIFFFKTDKKEDSFLKIKQQDLQAICMTMHFSGESETFYAFSEKISRNPNFSIFNLEITSVSPSDPLSRELLFKVDIIGSVF